MKQQAVLVHRTRIDCTFVTSSHALGGTQAPVQVLCDHFKFGYDNFHIMSPSVCAHCEIANFLTTSCASGGHNNSDLNLTQNFIPKSVSTIDASEQQSTIAIEDHLPPVCDALNVEQREDIAEIISTSKLLLKVGQLPYPTVYFGFETCSVPYLATDGPTGDALGWQNVIEHALEKAPDYTLRVSSETTPSDTIVYVVYLLETRFGTYVAKSLLQDSPANARHKVLIPVHGWVKVPQPTVSFLAGIDCVLLSMSESDG